MEVFNYGTAVCDCGATAKTEQGSDVRCPVCNQTWRIGKCFYCENPFDSRYDTQCPHCMRYVCGQCGSCTPDCEGFYDGPPAPDPKESLDDEGSLEFNNIENDDRL